MAHNTVKATKHHLDSGDSLDRRPGSGAKSKVDLMTVRAAAEAAPSKSMTDHAQGLGVHHSTVSRNIKKAGEKSLMVVEKPILTQKIRSEHLQHCKGLLNNLKSAPANRVIIFSDEKTWTVDPVRNHQNDWYIAFGPVEDDANVILTTKHPASIMSLGFMASSGKPMPLIWFLTGYRLTAAGYIDVLESKFLPWVHQYFPDGNVVLQQDGAPTHMAKRTQDFLEANMKFWPKTMWPPYSPNANPLDFSFWPHVEGKACCICHPNIDTLKAAVNQHWDNMDPDFICKTCAAFRTQITSMIEADGGYTGSSISLAPLT